MPTRPRPGTLPDSPVCSGIRAGAAFTAWANSWRNAGVSYDDAVEAIGEAGIRAVRGLPGHPGPAPVGWALSALRVAGGGPLQLVLPVAGDVRGVPAVPGLAAAGIHAGQLVVGTGLVFLPDNDANTAAGGAWMVWDVTRAAPVSSDPGRQQTVSQADGRLRLAILEATDALTRLELDRWNPQVQALSRTVHGVRLPPDHEPAAAALAARCTQLATIVDLARADGPGGALSAHGARHRDAALRQLDVAIREGLMTAYSAVSERGSLGG